MTRMVEMQMGPWLRHYLPAIPPEFGNDVPCWIARMQTRPIEHNPPFYWIGRALDIVAASGAEDTLRARLLAAHGNAVCEPRTPNDDRAQAVLSEACAFAWTHTHIGTPRIEVATEGGAIERDPVRLHVADHGTDVVPLRLRPGASGGEVFDDVEALTAEASARMSGGRGRVLFLDMLCAREYPQNAGYALALTEPVEAALHHWSGVTHMGHVFTRPFQWGNPVAAHY